MRSPSLGGYVRAYKWLAPYGLWRHWSPAQRLMVPQPHAEGLWVSGGSGVEMRSDESWLRHFSCSSLLEKVPVDHTRENLVKV